MTVKSADKKPEKYMGPDGKVKYRMVPVDREVMSTEAAVKEVSKGMVGRYLKKVPASAADAGRKSSGAMGIGPEDQKKQMKKGISQFVNRQRGTTMAVDKMTGKAKVPATEEAEKHVFRFSTKTKQGNHHHDSRDQKSAAAAIEKKTGEKVQSMTYRGKKSSMPMRREDSDAVKAFLAKGGKIKKLPPAKAQGYHGKDDPGKDMHGVMDKPDTKAMGTRKKVKSMEQTKESRLAQMLGPDGARKARQQAAARGVDNQQTRPYMTKAQKDKADKAKQDKKPMKTEMKTFWDLRAEVAEGYASYAQQKAAHASMAERGKKKSKNESMLGHRDAEKLNGGKSRDSNFKSPESHIDHHHRQTGGHEKSGGDADRHRYQVAKKLGYDV